ncbi:MAG: S41 family peptidase [Acidobacteria bacterium]|nr:S41 family peptidase [Acidobacteriota bacterium]
MKQSSTRLFALLLVLSLSSFGFAQSPISTAKTQPERAADGSKKAGSKPVTADVINSDIKEALAVIQSNYVGAKTLDYNEVFKSSIDSMLHSLDPHSNYFDAKEFEQFKTDQSSRYFGIGATIGDLSDPDGKVLATYIKATFEGAPAHRGGLRYGDKIVEVNGTSMLGKPFSEVRTFLRGPQGTSAKIVVERLATGKRETVDIVRDAVPQPSISEAYMIRPGIGYINMNGGFNQTTYNEFVQAMRQLTAAGMQQLVIDLRNNGGGLVSQAYRVANAFLSEGQVIFSQKGRMEGATDPPYRSVNRTPNRSPIVMLVNRNTASASEILAGALQDHDRALIVGEDTFGKGLVQNPFQLEYGSMLLLTIAKYETPAGRLIQRDYSNGELYNYYTEGGSLRDENQEAAKPKGSESKTDTGRSVYSGGGINPDVPIKPQTITNERARVQAKIAVPAFAYTLDLVVGKVKGLENYKVDKPITFDYDIKPTDYPISDAVFASFKEFAVEKYKIPAAQIDREKEFVERILRTELVTAAFGTQTSSQVFNEYDTQLLKAIELLPQAKQLAMQSERAKTVTRQKNTVN